MTLSEIYAAAVLVATVLSAYVLFSERSMFKVAIAAAALFAMASAEIFIIGQPAIALFQLFVLIGGASTYLVVAVASGSRSNYPTTNLAMLISVSIVVFATFSYVLIPSAPQYALPGVEVGYAQIAGAASHWQLVYAIVLLVFGTAIGSIIVIKSRG
jgi:hypothetical protein